MAITDLTTLKATVSRWAGGSSDTAFDETIADAVALAENEMNYGGTTPSGVITPPLRVPEMEVRAVVTIDESYESLPSDFLAMKEMWRVDDGRDRLLRWTALANIVALSGLSGPPNRYSTSGIQIRFGPPVVDAFTARLVYYARLPDLAASGVCTAVLARYPNLYLYGTLANLSGYLMDDARLVTWRGLFTSGINAANNASASRAGSRD